MLHVPVSNEFRTGANRKLVRTWCLACSTGELRLAQGYRTSQNTRYFPNLLLSASAQGLAAVWQGEVNGRDGGGRTTWSHLLSEQVTGWLIIMGCAMGRKTLCCYSSSRAGVCAQSAQGSCREHERRNYGCSSGRRDNGVGTQSRKI